VCLSVLPHESQKSMHLGIRTAKLDMEMFQDESWKPIYSGVKCQGHESQKHCRRGPLHSCECWLFLVCLDVCILFALGLVSFCVIFVVGVSLVVSTY